nr:hypothetical protein [Tanacetum cinerariifolium]
MKYLVVPLISKKLSLSDCKSLIENVETRINNWRNKLLSYAGGIQLIALVLSGMHQYRHLLYVIKELDKIFKRPKDHGGLGIKPLYKWNEVLMKAESSCNDSWGWKQLLDIRDKIKPFIRYKIDDGKGVSMCVWIERNKRIFKNKARSVDEPVTVIKKHVTDMLMSLKVESYGALVMVTKTWGLNLDKRRLVPLI